MISTVIIFGFLFINSDLASTSTKCVPNDETDFFVCSNISSILELSTEIQPTWGNIKIVNEPGEIFTITEHVPDRTYMVKGLDLSQAGRLEISDLGFSDFSFLKSLNFSGTETDTINKSWFAKLDALESLDISWNWIRYLNDSDLEGLSELRKLNVAHNAIETFHIPAEDVAELEYLNLSSNILSNIDLGEILKLRNLDLSSNRIFSIPSDAFRNMPALDTINLAGNSINTIGFRAFEPLYSLKVLNLSGNELEELTRFAFSGMSRKRLDILDLSHNIIQDITPGSLDELTRLKNFNLTYNKIERLSGTTFEGLRSLRSLDLSYNIIHAIPDNVFAPIRLLEVLNLSGNYIISLSHKIFGTSGLELKKLDLSYNEIITLPGNFFQTAPNIEYLDLSRNKITALDSNLFRYLTKLRKLNLSENSIEEISPNIVEDLNVVTELYIDHNEMKFFPDINGNQIPQLVNFTIKGNPWQCPCLDELLQFFMSRRIDLARTLGEGQKYDCAATRSNKCIKNNMLARNDIIDERKSRRR